jgi:CrcB protein
VGGSAWSNDPALPAAAPQQAPGPMAPRLPTLQIAVGGALGAGARAAIGGSLLLSAANPGPMRLLALNVIGAGLLGVLLGAALDPSRSTPAAARLGRWTPLLTTGFLGGLTTFSAMIVQAGGLGHRAGALVEGTARMNGTGLALAAGYLLASVTLGLVAFLAGRRLGQRRVVRGHA